jgi:hypothetical protein
VALKQNDVLQHNVPPVCSNFTKIITIVTLGPNPCIFIE